MRQFYYGAALLSKYFVKIQFMPPLRNVDIKHFFFQKEMAQVTKVPVSRLVKDGSDDGPAKKSRYDLIHSPLTN